MRIAKFSNNIVTEYHRIVGFVNLGDNIVSLAIDNIFDILGIKEKDVLEVPFFGECSISQECLLPVTGHFDRQYEMGFIKNEKIHPVFLGIGIKDDFLTEEELNYFKKNEPILCRDEFTCNVLKKYGVCAYVFGCITLLFPKREKKSTNNKIFFVDVDNEYLKCLPYEVINNAEFETHNLSIDFNKNTNSFDIGEIAVKLLKKYSDEAGLVVTSRLHCMTPCVAMGIPTIALGENFSYRYGYIDAFIKSYNKDTINQIQWNSISENDALLSYVKPLMVEIIKSMFNGSPDIKKIKELDKFYKNRNKWPYFYRIEKKLQIFFDGGNSDRYIIWGASSGGYAVYTFIKQRFPNAEIIGAIDMYANGLFAGLCIDKPEEIIKKFNNAKIIVSTLSGKENAFDYLVKIGKVEDKDFIFVHENM